ncbi:uncharacterized protein LOC111291661 isoform X1 [Durio zibethinus]|uniref:Uncharacterized protein LOC111291661 isoform X1 n=1 Tax=Durio zibethinus TaxID=66656 RepID=A0A6P5YFG9_DURZI|nr:uncharacterized protein LOC111291661 isoform X1 [Durio zibethinus]
MIYSHLITLQICFVPFRFIFGFSLFLTFGNKQWYSTVIVYWDKICIQQGEASTVMYEPCDLSMKSYCLVSIHLQEGGNLSFWVQGELELIEKMDKASAACKEMLSIVESRPDPLLPITNGPLNPLWDQWFEGPQEAQGCKCWIL